jgi:hypothetical protein
MQVFFLSTGFLFCLSEQSTLCIATFHNPAPTHQCAIPPHVNCQLLLVRHIRSLLILMCFPQYGDTVCNKHGLSLIKRCLRDVHEIIAYRAGDICVSVRMIQLENRWANLDEIWYGRYAIGDYPKIVLHSNTNSGRTNL